jgi:biotin synthase-related radical SAM superfamily protein
MINLVENYRRSVALRFLIDRNPVDYSQLKFSDKSPNFGQSNLSSMARGQR